MALLVLAYPEISKSDYEWIQGFRKRHDELYYHVVEPHFTIVFPVSDWEPEPFFIEISKQSKGFKPFDFCIRCATITRDATNDYYHTFLVPDEGYSNIVKIHDALYADELFPNRNLEIDFTPHIGIGNSRDPLKCHEIACRWNNNEFSIPGRIETLDIVNYENDKVQTIKRISL